MKHGKRRKYIKRTLNYLIFVIIVYSIFLAAISLDRGGTGTSRPGHICVNLGYGRLGNNMFQYASSFGISKTKNMSVLISTYATLGNIFEMGSAKRIVMHNHTPCNLKTKRLYEKKQCSYDERFLKVNRHSNVMFGTYLQSWKYFQHAEMDLRQEFRFNKAISERAYAFIQSVTRDNVDVTLVGLHVRRGDMAVASRRKSSGYNIASKAYITRAMGYFLTKYVKILFVVCSDQMKWVKENFKNYSNMVLVEHQKPEVDLAILALCNHTIMTVGTFGWWAAWLARGTTLYFSRPIKEHTMLRIQFSKNYSDYFYPGWIGLE